MKQEADQQGGGWYGQDGDVWYSLVWHGMVQYGMDRMVMYGIVQYGMAWVGW